MEWLWTLSPTALCVGTVLVAMGIKRLAAARQALAVDLVGLEALSDSLDDVRGKLGGMRGHAQVLTARAASPDSSDFVPGR